MILSMSNRIKSSITKQSSGSKCSYGHSKTKFESCNPCLGGEDGDVLLLASDDMNPAITGYDGVIMEAFRQSFPDFDGSITF